MYVCNYIRACVVRVSMNLCMYLQFLHVFLQFVRVFLQFVQITPHTIKNRYDKSKYSTGGKYAEKLYTMAKYKIHL